MKYKSPFLLALATCVSCGQSGQSYVEVPLYLAGSELSEPFLAQGGVEVTVQRARLAYGPLYLCAGNTAGDLCETARLEWLQTAVVDLANATPQRAGALQGVSGPVRSWMYDLGLSSQLTRSEPFVLEAAMQLGGASVVLEGTALVQEVPVPFFAEVRAAQTQSTELGVPVVRKSATEEFVYEVLPDEAGLLVRFNVEAWLTGFDFRPYASDESCSTEAGCTSLLSAPSDSEWGRSLRNALVSGERPSFEWNYSQ